MARQRSGRRTDYEWSSVCGVVTAADLVVGSSTGIIWSFAATTALTIQRIRGNLHVDLDPSAADERAIIAFGIGKASTDAVTAGEVPELVVDAGFPWMWFGFATVTALGLASASGHGLFDRMEIDIKAMRKMKPQESIFLVGNVCGVVDQGGTFDVMSGARVLLGS